MIWHQRKKGKFNALYHVATRYPETLASMSAISSVRIILATRHFHSWHTSARSVWIIYSFSKFEFGASLIRYDMGIGTCMYPVWYDTKSNIIILKKLRDSNIYWINYYNYKIKNYNYYNRIPIHSPYPLLVW